MPLLWTDLDFGVMWDSRLAILSWQGDFEDSKRAFVHRVRVTIPAICNEVSISPSIIIPVTLTEVSNQKCLLGIGCPFSVSDGVVLIDVEPILVHTLNPGEYLDLRGK